MWCNGPKGFPAFRSSPEKIGHFQVKSPQTKDISRDNKVFLDGPTKMFFYLFCSQSK